MEAHAGEDEEGGYDGGEPHVGDGHPPVSRPRVN